MGNIAADELGTLWALVDHLGYDLEPSILIGGWATQLRVGGEVSKHIDLIINSPELRQKLREVLDDYSENTLHSGGSRKGRGTIRGVHVDAYMPYESVLGNELRLDVTRLAAYTDDQTIKGWLLLTLEAHLATKFAALLDRPDSEKGEKDAREITRLVDSGASAAATVAVLLDATGGPVDMVPQHVRTVFELLPDLAALNKADRKRYAQLRREWVDEAEVQLRRRDL